MRQIHGATYTDAAAQRVGVAETQDDAGSPCVKTRNAALPVVPRHDCFTSETQTVAVLPAHVGASETGVAPPLRHGPQGPASGDAYPLSRRVPKRLHATVLWQVTNCSCYCLSAERLSDQPAAVNPWKRRVSARAGCRSAYPHRGRRESGLSAPVIRTQRMPCRACMGD